MALWVEEKAWVFVGKIMKRIDRQEYDDLMNYLQSVFLRSWEHENEERKKSGKSLDMFQFGFPINEIYHYQTGDEGEDFYIIYNTLFLSTISRQIKLAQQQYPQKFGTGNADDLIDALYNVSNYKLLGDRAAYLDYLIDYNCCYVVYRKNGVYNDILRIDLLRDTKPNKKDPTQKDIIGGMLHVLKHFSIEGKNLGTGTDINDVFDVTHLIYLIAMAFRLKKKCAKCKYEAIQKFDTYAMHASFYRNPTTDVYYLNTYFKDRNEK